MRKDYLKMNSDEMLISKFLVEKGIEKKRKKINYQGWVCGTYTSSVRKTIAMLLHSKFSQKELNLLCHYFNLYKENKRLDEIQIEAINNNINLPQIGNFIMSNYIPNMYKSKCFR